MRNLSMDGFDETKIISFSYYTTFEMLFEEGCGMIKRKRGVTL